MRESTAAIGRRNNHGDQAFLINNNFLTMSKLFTPNMYRACKLLKFVSMVSMFLTISGDKQKNCGAKVGPAGARAPAVKACAPAVPRQLDQRRQRAERGTCPSAPLKIIVPRLCPGSTIFLAPPLQVLRYMHLHLCSFNLSCLFWLVIVLATNSSQMRPLRYFVAPRYTATVIRHVASIVRQMDWVLHTLRPTFYHDTTCTNYLHNWAHFALFFSGKR